MSISGVEGISWVKILFHSINMTIASWDDIILIVISLINDFYSKWKRFCY